MQETLDRASEGRTTIVVSHRMSAIKNADRIVFIHKGQVVEDGTHNELIALNGHYYQMVKSTHHELENDDESQIDNKLNPISDGKPTRRKVCFNLTQPTVANEIEEDEENSVAFWKSFKRIPGLIKSDWIIVIIAICSSIILGSSASIFSVIYAEIFAVS